jgi:diguanylate cyclase (GGDEF)-like protein
MHKSSELLRSYVQEIKHLSGAAAVSLFVPATPNGISNATLIHAGAAAVPEFADLSSAERWAASILSAELEAGREPTGSAALQRSEAEGGWLIQIPAVQTLFHLAATDPGAAAVLARKRRRSDEEQATPPQPAAWIGLRFEPGSMVQLPDFNRVQDSKDWWGLLLALGAVLAWHLQEVVAILADPVTGLPGRPQFQASLSEGLASAKRTARPLCLLFINPDDFAGVNERFGREPSDRIIREIAGNLRSTIRSSDLVAKYGGAIFASVLNDTPLSAAKVVAENVLRSLTERAYLEGAVRLGFSIGVATFDPKADSSEEPLDLIRRADQALNAAKRSGGGCIAIWEAGSEIEELGQLDRLAGIFTGQMAKDYRNMVMLWDVLYLMAANLASHELEEQVVERLYATLKQNRVALFGLSESGEPVLRAGIARQPGLGAIPGRVTLEDLNAEELDLINQGCRRARLLETAIAGESSDGEAATQAHACVIPLLAAEQNLGCLYLEGRSDSLKLDGSDLIFLQALAAQLAVALDRARLSEQERGRLRAELNELREALQKAKLVYRSPQMSAVLATARRVAPTDATVLITGESGTGKELLAHTIHELSPRRKKPLVVVDCAAISSTLIDSELFGHERGAYTGAQVRTIGRLTEADGGTVLLDEIGELPLDVQSKLLRFVQEKQLTPVGSTRSRAVDVRVLASTNRDLAVEVADKRFREDLYHRLNVVRLVVPPLRERPQDILYLAEHFLSLYSTLYHKSIRCFAREAREALLAYPWTGNVRELQNRLMQAVIMCDRDELGSTELGFSGVVRPSAHETVDPWLSPPAAGMAARPRDRAGCSSISAPTGGGSPAATAPSEGSFWEKLRAVLAEQIERTVQGKLPAAVPYGKWMSDDLVLLADQVSNGVARRAAKIVGLPETTFRRRLLKASEERQAGLAARTEAWEQARRVLAELVQSAGEDGSDLLERTESILLREIVQRFPKGDRTGSALLGVTVPTYRRRIAQLQ